MVDLGRLKTAVKGIRGVKLYVRKVLEIALTDTCRIFLRIQRRMTQNVFDCVKPLFKILVLYQYY